MGKIETARVLFRPIPSDVRTLCEEWMVLNGHYLYYTGIGTTWSILSRDRGQSKREVLRCRECRCEVHLSRKLNAVLIVNATWDDRCTKKLPKTYILGAGACIL